MLTPIRLFRLGNATSPRMDNVRSKDIEMYDIAGQTWVRAGTGGISTSAFAGPLTGNWWRLDPGYDLGVLLLVRNDYDRHWSWEPTKDMPLADFRAALGLSHPHFVRL